MTEHEGILELKDRMDVFQAEDTEEVEQMFYNQLTLDEILENLQEFNCLIGEIKQILREVEVQNPKADMVDMLEDLRLDFQEATLVGVVDNKEVIFADEVDDLVQQKINELKAE